MVLSGSFFTLLSSDIPDGTGTYGLKLNPEHFIFRCHFPEQPIVPGVCIVQMLSELLSDYAGRHLYVKEMRRVKFVRPVYPGVTPELLYRVVSYKDDGEAVCVSAVLTPSGDEHDVLCKLSLTLVSEAF